MTAITTVDRGPRVVARSVTVNAPADELFALVNDPRKHGLVDGSGRRGAVRAPGQVTRGVEVRRRRRGRQHRSRRHLGERERGIRLDSCCGPGRCQGHESDECRGSEAGGALNGASTSAVHGS